MSSSKTIIKNTGRKGTAGNDKKHLWKDELVILKEVLEDWIAAKLHVVKKEVAHLWLKVVRMCGHHIPAEGQNQQVTGWSSYQKYVSRAIEKKGRQFAQQFAHEVWKQCRMWVVVMVAWKGPDGDVLTSLLFMVKHLMTGVIWKTDGASMPRTYLSLGRMCNLRIVRMRS
ncbi:hypothetical protein J3A83DRAFT_4184549 [Scleroderma citrinum]